ncbi:unnamed protein product [Absidia cylindrospora]
MIEEKERKNQDAVVNNDKASTSGISNSDESRPSSKNTFHTRQSYGESSSHASSQKPLPQRFSSDDPGVDFSVPKKDYTIVPVATQHHQQRQPTGDPNRHSFLDTHKVSAATKQFTGKVWNRMMNGTGGVGDGANNNNSWATTEKPPRRSQQEDRQHQRSSGLGSKQQPHSLIGIPIDDEVPKRNKVKVRAEPKTFFANERTFISWLQFCALLLTVALNLMNFATDHSTRAVGGIFMVLSAIIAIYALYRFEKRAWMINNQVDGRYDDLV